MDATLNRTKKIPSGKQEKFNKKFRIFERLCELSRKINKNLDRVQDEMASKVIKLVRVSN